MKTTTQTTLTFKVKLEGDDPCHETPIRWFLHRMSDIYREACSEGFQWHEDHLPIGLVKITIEEPAAAVLRAVETDVHEHLAQCQTMIEEATGQANLFEKKHESELESEPEPQGA